ASGAPASDDEYDVVVASGEQVSAGLVAMILRNMGRNARSWLAGEIPIVAGFQGVGRDGRLATLGRGAGDLSAVAIAAALKADRCDIYTDVDGVYTTDPRIVTKARKLNK